MGDKMNFLSMSFVRRRVIAFAATSAVAIVSLATAHMPSSRAMAEDSARNPAISAEAPFLAENDAAMSKMMADMAVKPTGDVDRDFVEMMVPHHQGAIDMAKAVLRYGKNEQLRRLAQEIIVTQQQEIAAMRLAMGDPLPPSVASPTAAESAATPSSAMQGTMDMSHGTMSHGSHSATNSMKMK
jgi:uncharacterized protein (DUF305 family)